jgi:hypothetical protein
MDRNGRMVKNTNRSLQRTKYYSLAFKISKGAVEEISEFQEQKYYSQKGI